MNFYQTLENKYYALLDKIPWIYKIVDPIDKHFPSMILFIIIIIAIIAGIAFLLMGITLPGNAQVILTITDLDGNPLSGISPSLEFGGILLTDKVSDGSGKISLIVPLDSTLFISVNSSGYQKFEDTVLIDANPFDYSFKLTKLSEIVTKKIIFKSSGMLLSGTNIDVELSCSNSDVSPVPSSARVSNGQLEVQIPPNCGTLIANAFASGYNSINGWPIVASTEVISLTTKSTPDSEKSSIIVEVMDDIGPLENIKVDLLDEWEETVDVERTTYNGTAVFDNLESGSYVVLATDDWDEEHIPARSERIKLDESETRNIVVRMPRILPDGTNPDEPDQNDVIITDENGNTTIVNSHSIKVKVLNAKTNQRLSDVEVKLYNTANELIATSNTGENAEEIEFTTLDQNRYKVEASKEGFVPESVLTLTGKAITIKLDEITLPTTGNIKVFVVDEENRKVRNAKVFLTDEEGFIQTKFGSKLSDINGTVTFKGLKEGTFKAFAVKGKAAGSSTQSIEVLIGDTAELEVKIIIGNALMKIEVVNPYDEPVGLADITIFKENGEKIGTIKADADGKAEQEIKADSDVYLKIESEDYATQTTSLFVLKPETTVDAKITLDFKAISGNPKIEFEGVYSNGTITSSLSANQEYDVKLKIILPQTISYTQAGIHFRVGEDSDLIENQKIIIKTVNASNAAITKGTTFTPPLGQQTDFDGANLTNGSSKWVNIVWTNPSAGTYTATIKIKVLGSAMHGDSLRLAYRSWAKTAARKYLRDPVDNVLGQGESSSAKNELYANVLEKSFVEGTVPKCNEFGICYVNETIENTDTQLFELTPYVLPVENTYIYTFELKNQSEARYKDAELYLKAVSPSGRKDASLEFLSYEVINANAQKISGSSLTDKQSIEKINLGDFAADTSVRVKLTFKTKKVSSDTRIQRNVFFEKIKRYSEVLSLEVLAEKPLVLKLEPDIIAAFVENDLNVWVFDSEQMDNPVEGAMVKVEKITTELDRVFIGIQNTSKRGLAGFTKATGKPIPVSYPGEKIVITATKLGYAPATAEIVISSDIVQITPQNLSASLNTQTNPREAVLVKFKNLVGIDLKIKELSLSGDFKGLLDRGTMDNYLSSMIGEEINAKTERELELIEFFLTNTANKSGTVTGSLTIILTNDALGIDWPFVRNFTAEVTAGAPIETQKCLTIEGPELPHFRGAVEEGKIITTEFDIVNNCVINGQDVDLKDLQVKFNLSGNTNNIGTWTVEVEGSTFDLRQARWTVLTGGIRKNSSLHGSLSFTPKAGVTNQEVSADIYFDAINEVNGEKEYVNNKGYKVDATVQVVNLSECVKIKPEENEILEIAKDESEPKFTVINECVTPIKIRLCNGEESSDTDACGNNRNGQGLLSQTNFETQIKAATGSGTTITPEEKEIALENPSIPGAYSVKVEAKLDKAGSTYREVKRLKVNKIDYLYFSNPFVQIDIQGNDFNATTTYLYNSKVGEYGAFSGNLDWVEINDATWEQKLNGWDEFAKGFGTAGGIAYAGSLVAAASAESIVLVAPWTAAAIINPITAGILVIAVGVGLAWEHIFPATKEELKYYMLSYYYADIDTVPFDENPVSLGVVSKTEQLNANIYDLGGDRYRRYYKVNKWMWGQGNEDHDMTWELACPKGYDINQIVEDIRKKDDCSYEGYTIEGEDTVIFKGKCDGHRFHDFELKVDNYLLCDYVNWNPRAGTVPINFSIENQQLKDDVNSGQPVYVNLNVKGTGLWKFDHWENGAPIYKESSETTTVGRIRVELKARPKAELPDLDLNTHRCESAGLKGVSGTGALPKIGLTHAPKIGWNWNDISLDTCNQFKSNGTDEKTDYIYCDATQASIEIMKRIHSVDEFLKANNYSFSCPKVLTTEQSGIQYSVNESSNTVPANSVASGKIGINAAELAPNQNTARIIVRLTNKTSSEQKASITVNVVNSALSYSNSCTKNFSDTGDLGEIVYDISSGGGVSALACDFLDLKESTTPYTATITINSTTATAEQLSPKTGEIKFTVSKTDYGAASTNCKALASTAILGGEFIPYTWLNKTEYPSTVTQDPALIAWTGDIKNLTDFRNITHFNAYLIKDGYSNDFRADFDTFAKTKDFFGAPAYYKDASNGLSKYFANNQKMKFIQANTLDNYNVPAGLYSVDLEINPSNNWELFDSSGNPTATIVVKFTQIRPPGTNQDPDSIFYYLPINGNIGLVGDNLDRVNYGISYTPGTIVSIDSGANNAKTHSSAGSIALRNVTVQKQGELQKLNVSTETRGDLLRVKQLTDSSTELIFSPNYATPLMLSVENSNLSPVSVFYKLLENDTAKDIGTMLTYWNGAAKLECADFTGNPVWEEFVSREDQTAESTDQQGVGLDSYKISWDSVNKTGKVWLKTVLYTPTDKDYQLLAIMPLTKMNFLTPDMAAAKTVSLQGISSMAKNHAGDPINSIQDIFELVKNDQACISDNGYDLHVWWNEKALNEQKGSSGKSIADMENALVPGKTCIQWTPS